MFYNHFENHVQVAVERVGGPTKVSTLFGIATGTVHSWIRARRISKIDYATKLAELSGMQVQDLRGTR